MSAPVQIRDHLDARPPALGASKLVCIDGPSGSGKTTVATQLARIAPATVLHTDEYCPGWDGLPAVPGILVDLLTDLAAGRTGQIREWDWIRERPGQLLVVEPAPLIVVEGVGAGALPLAPWISTLVYLDANTEARRTRAFERDGDYFRDQWAPWADAERAYFSQHRVPERADLAFRTG